MKKSLLALTLLTSLTVSQATHAGIFFAGATGISAGVLKLNGEKVVSNRLLNTSMITSGLVSTVLVVGTKFFPASMNDWQTTSVLMLSADGSLAQNELADKLEIELKGLIDNRPAIEELAAIVKAKYELQKDTDGSAEVKLTEEDLAILLERLDLSSEQKATLIEKLG